MRSAMKTIALLLLLSVTIADSASASQAWGVNVGGSGPIRLQSIDIKTGGVTSISQSGDSLLGASVRDLASDPVRDATRVWAVRSSGVGNELIAVDPYRELLLSYTLIDAPSDIRSLAIDPTTGVMYGASTGELYTIDPLTGSTMLLGNTAVDNTAEDVSRGLGFDNAGQLFGIGGSNRLLAIDKTNASSLLIAELPLLRMEDIAVRPEDGVMYGLGYSGYDLYKIDTADGSVTSVGPSVGRPGGLAFTAVPEPSGLTLLVLVGFVGCGRVCFRPGYGRGSSVL